MNRLELRVNGALHLLPEVEDQTLLDILRDELGLKGAKYGCGMGQCGACTVLVDGNPARACVLRARRVHGHSVTTLEGLADPTTGAMSVVQRAFLECQAAQCGYCLNGMVMTATALLTFSPMPRREQIRDAMRHNLCRCGTHLEIIAAIEKAAERLLEARNV